MTILRAAAAALALAWAGTATAQAPAPANWPNKPITFVVPYAAGGPTDVVARTIA
ncbi:MAG TPA: tripartite tricarboxylate transporter substrate binding protein BugD, partial [Ramlibacter sp.]|nr:tripartite tricarboxylate transporter substrate binding protein BugD [Ramlibacter sp.]